ncbi:nucleoside triphosphate hydrolase protein [Wolfiporia cocos MD-104 SS10]|uniref:RNA helicase n=1 Tax=Wolfiporia cocos (strain MD-104) TaxID=742152 RepID=A0A2H3JRK9_WOLCO|nr:nucleoside triphosphate hydrolase protein [Wolfiporia cocos MD-104 SS10]
MVSNVFLNFCPGVLYSGKCQETNCTLQHDAKLCELCGVICTPVSIYNSHIKGKPHRDILAANSSWLRCPLCDIRVNSEVVWRSHVSGAGHRKAAAERSMSADVQPVGGKYVPDNAKRCVLCQRNIPRESWTSHVGGQDHKRHEYNAAYKAAYEQAANDKEGVTVSYSEGVIDFGVLSAEQGRVGLHKEVIIRTVTASRQISVVRTTASATSSSSTCRFSTILPVPCRLVHGKDTTLMVVFRHTQAGRYEGRIEIEFKDERRRFLVVRQVRATIGNAADHKALKPSAPYTRPKRVQWRKAQRYYLGHRPPMLDAVPWIKKLRTYEVSARLSDLLSKGATVDSLECIRTQLLPRVFNSSTHGLHFKTLLWCEEYRLEQDLRMYDLGDVTFKKEGNLYYLVVPGLAEKRPSVVVGDRVEVQSSGSTADSCYVGWVHVVRREDVGVGFHPSFKPSASQRFNVRFALNRVPLRRQHQALGQLVANAERFLFPQKVHAGLSRAPTATDLNIVIFNPRVATNQAQLQAVRSILQMRTGAAPFIIYGPPGTGKTVTIVEAIRQILSRDPDARILACAPSNSAADEIARRLTDIDTDTMFRFNAVSRDRSHVHAEVLPYTYTNVRGDFSVPELEKLLKFSLIISTCGSASFAFGIGVPPGHFGHIFVDEAGQATEAEAMTAIKPLAVPTTKIVLSGDPKQLGPIIKSSIARELNFGKSYLERLMEMELYNGANARGISMMKLVQSFRSHEAILNYPNEQFYQNELIACGNPSIINSLLGSPQLVSPKFPVVFHAVAGRDEREASSPSYFNVDEISLVKEYVTNLKADRGRPIEDEHIGVIAPYNAQVRKLRRALSEVAGGAKIASVEEFQGQERRIIILSTVRSSRDLLAYDAKYTLGFVSNPRRFNVAVTRAQALLVVVGDPAVLSLDPLWRRFLNYIHNHGGWRGDPITWDPYAPVRDDTDYAQEAREQAMAFMSDLMQRVETDATDNDMTAPDYMEGQANMDIVTGDVE